MKNVGKLLLVFLGLGLTCQAMAGEATGLSVMIEQNLVTHAESKGHGETIFDTSYAMAPTLLRFVAKNTSFYILPSGMGNTLSIGRIVGGGSGEFIFTRKQKSAKTKLDSGEEFKDIQEANGIGYYHYPSFGVVNGEFGISGYRHSAGNDFIISARIEKPIKDTPVSALFGISFVSITTKTEEGFKTTLNTKSYEILTLRASF